MILQQLEENEKRSQIAGNLKDCSKYSDVNFLNVNMFVEAGAGAGKTTLIVQRIVNQLKAGDTPGSFVVITFTNAAAEELRGRIAQKVKAEGLNDALAHLDEMNISTIHSFCNVLLKEQCILAKLPMNIELMDESENYLLQKEYFGKYLSELTKNDWDNLEKDAKQDETRWSVKGDLEELYHQIADLPGDMQIITPKNIDNASKALINLEQNIDEIAKKLLEVSKALLSDDIPAEEKARFNTLQDFSENSTIASAKFNRFVELYNDTQKEKDITISALLEVILGGGDYFKKPVAKKEQVLYKMDDIDVSKNIMKEYVNSKTTEIRAFFNQSSNKKDDEDEKISALEEIDAAIKKERHYRCLLEYAKKAKEYYLENRPKNKMSNDNLLEYTKNLICNEEDTRALEFFSKKYKHFYVDEFQDTDKIQESFIYRLASDLNDKNHIKLRDGALFVVGDPKQSIYRFRGAQPKVYFDVKKRMSDASMKNTYVYELENNFRSNEKVINWVNEKFLEAEEFMPIVDVDNPYKKMKPVKKSVEKPQEENKLIQGIYHYQNSDATKKGKVVVSAKPTKKEPDRTSVIKDGLIWTEDTTENDIRAVVNLILNLKNEGYKITRYDAAFNAYEDDIKFKDFLLIVHERKNMSLYLSALKKHGIPVRFDGSDELSNDKILNMYTRLYWYLVNPKEPFHRVAAKEAIRQSNLVEYEETSEQLDKYTNALIDFLYEKSKSQSAFGKAVFLEKQLSALLDKNKLYDVIQIYSAKTRIRQMIENVLEHADGTGIQIATAFDKYVSNGIEHELSLEDDADAVRFMNLHKTKGLEGEIVILLDRRGRKSMGLTSLRDGQSFYPGIKKWSSVSGIQMYTDKNKAEEEAEFHRLEYVAVTRAKQAVIFMNTIKPGGLFATSNKKKGPKNTNRELKNQQEKGYNYYLDKTSTVKEIIEQKDNHCLHKEKTDKDNYDLAQDGYGVIKEEAEMSVFYETINPSKLEKKHSYSKAKFIYENKKRLEKYGKLDGIQELFKRPAGNILGNVLHRAMELLIDRYDCSITDDDKIRTITEFCTRQAVLENENDIPKEDSKEEYHAYVQSIALAYYKWLNDNKLLDNLSEKYTELPFSYFEEVGEKHHWVHGTADLILKYNDGRIVLIDYKSDNDFLVDEQTMCESFREKYAPQVAVYREIIKRMFNVSENDIETAIISFSLKDEWGNRLKDNSLRVRYTPI